MGILTILLIVVILLVAIFFAYKASQPREDYRLNELKFNVEAIKTEFPKIEATIKSAINAENSYSRICLFFKNAINAYVPSLYRKVTYFPLFHK